MKLSPHWILFITGVFLVLTTAPAVALYNQSDSKEGKKQSNLGIFQYEVTALSFGAAFIVIGLVWMGVRKGKINDVT